ncbi:2-hydroxy-6-oxo-2,4-heptadienoate hydrolase [Janibacter sp. Soil728]|uniref:alpha/beta fold hydrolase n=1 Tax=Janibacter sp. Soil728 TaxID=1736393 RepID=UPI0006FE7D3D|nr:alpha/beta hydrolase [Janibacter sp. Soil728]KRE39025.1 2-hydroxy-6-oxo-2,4-heptadienoate hydrolase [Janibacter sp. Soil728]
MTTLETANPEIAATIDVGGIATNYHDVGEGDPVLLIHGSGPGVSAWANWRTVLPELSKEHRVIAPDILGFGYTERPDGVTYDMATWTEHLVGLLDALGLDRVAIIGNSFGGALALNVATHHPDRVSKLVLMGAVGVPFEITEGLDKVWGFEPSLANMVDLMGVFAYDQSLLTEDLAKLRLEAATRPGVHEAYSAMFPAPRQRSVEAMTVPDSDIRSLTQPTLIVHGRDDEVIPLSNSMRLNELIEQSQLHVYGQCGHWVQIEHTASFSQLVGNFLA